MQKSLDQMNVQVHRAVTDITGATGMAIVCAIVAGERAPERLAIHRDARCRKSAEEIAQYLAGNWREEHLFNLASALRLFDAVEHELASYELRMTKELESLQPPERRDQPVPPHPKPAKERAIRGRGEQELRTALFRFAGVDLTRIDGISAGATRVVLTEVGTDLRGSGAHHGLHVGREELPTCELLVRQTPVDLLDAVFRKRTECLRHGPTRGGNSEPIGPQDAHANHEE